MSFKFTASIFVIIVLLIVGGLFILQDKDKIKTLMSEPEKNQSLPSIYIKNVDINVELANTWEKRAQGLSGRDKLAENQGMLFIYDKSDLYSFWMKEMKFPIDIIWIDENYQIIDVAKNIMSDSFPQIFRPQKSVQYVLEVQGGFSDKNNIEIGDMVDFSEVFPGGKFKELVFIEDAKNHQVIVLNLIGEIIKKIKVGKEPHDITSSPDGKFIATGNLGDGTVSLINTQTLLVEKTILTGKGTHGVVFNPDGNFLFVTNIRESTLLIIETETFIRQTKVKIGDFFGDIPEYVGVTKDNSKIFTTNLRGKGSVTVLENKGFESKIIKTLYLGIDPHGWALSPDGSKVVITNLGSNLIYLLDTETFEEISHIDTGSTTEFAAFKDNTELWVTNIGAHYVSIIDIEQNRILDQIIVGETPHGISFSSDKTFAFVPLYKPGEVVIIDVVARKIIKKVKIGEKLHNSVVVKLNSDES